MANVVKTIYGFFKGKDEANGEESGKPEKNHKNNKNKNLEAHGSTKLHYYNNGGTDETAGRKSDQGKKSKKKVPVGKSGTMGVEDIPIGDDSTAIKIDAISAERIKKMPDLYSDDTDETSKYNLYPKLEKDDNYEDIATQQLYEINNEFISLNKVVVKFIGTKNDLVFISLEEKLMQLLMRLDDIETRNIMSIKQTKGLLIPLVKSSIESIKDKAEKISEDLSSAASFSVKCDILSKDDKCVDLNDFGFENTELPKNDTLEKEKDVNFRFNEIFTSKNTKKHTGIEYKTIKNDSPKTLKANLKQEASTSKSDQMYTEKVFKTEDSELKPAYDDSSDTTEVKEEQLEQVLKNVFDSNITPSSYTRSQTSLQQKTRSSLNLIYEANSGEPQPPLTSASTDEKGPVQLLKFNNHGKFELNEESVHRIFSREELKNRKFAIISIVGEFRRGKSFLLNFMLRYLYAKGHTGCLNADMHSLVQGFSWRGGKERDTTGILMWPEPFIVSNDLALLLMDTQGTFDNKTTMQANAFIFAFSTLVSSVQIFNLSERIQMDDLHNLQYFLEFGRLIHSECDAKAFQKLIFLIRDWKFSHQDPFGFAGGEKVLGDWFKTDTESVTHEQAEMITTCFREIQCYLMPHPGEIVSAHSDFKGNLSDIKQEFLNYMERFLESVLSPLSLNAKMVGHNVINASEMILHMRNWVQHLQEEGMQAKTMFESMAEMSHEKAVTESLDIYIKAMQSQLSLECDAMVLHESQYADAMRNFESTKKFGNTSIGNKHRQILSDTIRDKFELIARNLQDEREKDKNQKLHEILDTEFISFQSQVNGFILDTNYEISLQEFYNKLRAKAMENLKAELSSLLSERRLKEEFANADKRMFTYIKGIEPNYLRKKQRDERKIQSDEIKRTCDSALVLYRNWMESKCGSLKAVPNVESIHTEAWKQMLTLLEPIIEKVDASVYGKNLEKLEGEIQELYNRYQTQNSEKLRVERGEELRLSLREVQSQCIRKFQAELEKHCAHAMSNEMLQKVTTEVKNRALSEFEGSVDKYGIEDCKPYFTAAKHEITEIIKQNKTNNNKKTSNITKKRLSKAKTIAIQNYIEKLTSLGLQKAVLDLEMQHKAALEKVLDIFSDLEANGIDCRNAVEDTKADINEKYQEIDKKNKELIQEEVEKKCIRTLQNAYAKSLEIYKEVMTKKCKNLNRGGNFDEIHTKSTVQAFEEFDDASRCFGSTNSTVLEYRRSLTKGLNSCKDEFEMFQSKQERAQNIECKTAVQECLKEYSTDLEIETEEGFKWVQNLEAAHQKLQTRSIHKLCEKIQNIGKNISPNEYENLLIVEIEDKWQIYNSKNIQLQEKIRDDEIDEVCLCYATCLTQYKEAMANDEAAKDVPRLSLLHSTERDQCISNFKTNTRQCDTKLVAEYCEKLEQNITDTFEDLKVCAAKQARNYRQIESVDPEEYHAIGIDLGTTFSCVAVYVNKSVHVIKNKIGKTTTPSAVYFHEDRYDVGEKALHEGIVDSKNCVSEVKRIIGRKFDDPIVTKVASNWNFMVNNDDGKPIIEVTKGAKKKYTPEDISALVLTEMKEQAELALGCKIHDAVVTIPSHFNELQRQATKNACIQAGLNLLRMINEPTAAALAYGIQCKSARLLKIFVFDFGGGTCDVSILTVQGGQFTVKASQGDNHLGGEDFDYNMTKYLAEKLETKHSIKLDTNALRRLRRQCERVKRYLSDLKTYDLEIEHFVDEIGLNETITREQFETVNAELFTRALIPVKDCLTEANMKIEDIDEVVLVGGSSRIPKIIEILKRHFNGKTLNCSINPDEAIAYGAAIQAAVCIDQYKGKVCIEDITPMSLGTDVLHNNMSIIIPKNTIIPCSRTETYTTTIDNQKTINVEVYQGDDRKNKQKNILIGKFKLDNLQAGEAGSVSADITFQLDADGILHVTAKEKSADNVRSIQINKIFV